VPETAVILLVEDSDDDVVLIRRAFEKAFIPTPIQVVHNGEAALMYLKGEGIFSNRAEYPLPNIVLLDLKLPGMDGFAVLSWIRKQPGVQTLPVIVLTTSNRISDVNRAYRLGANSFFVKEIDFDRSVEFAKTMGQYWLQMALNPQNFRPDHTPKEAEPPPSSKDDYWPWV
jgi:CheY-like chemotaxis protein